MYISYDQVITRLPIADRHLVDMAHIDCMLIKKISDLMYYINLVE